MFASLQKIQALEMSLQNHMAEYASGCRGSFTMGISASRAQVILPRVMPRYCRAFPNVEVRFFLNDTVVLEENLRKGEVDLFLGVNTRYSDDLCYRRLCEDDLCFMISRGLLREYLGEGYGESNANAKMEVDLRKFAGIPFIKSYPTSVMNSICEGIWTKTIFHSTSRTRSVTRKRRFCCAPRASARPSGRGCCFHGLMRII